MYRRGLLKEGYAYGMTSRLREFMLGDMLLMEEAAENREKALTLSYSMLGPNVDRKKYREVMNNYIDTLDEIIELKGYGGYIKQEKRKQELSIFESLMRDYQRMEENGTIAAFRKECEEIVKELERQQA